MNKTIRIRGNRDPKQAKSQFLLTHPLQAEGDESLDAVASCIPYTFVPELKPYAEKGQLLFTHAFATAPAPVHKPRIHIIGLGDVGAHCALGLRLMGQNDLQIGLYARNTKEAEAMRMELLQCRPPDLQTPMPDVYVVEKERLTECDALVFAASAGVPAVLKEGDDVRMMQFAANRKILSEYLQLLRASAFTGTLFILSDPVDALCSCSAKELDFFPRERIIGLGLGVMAARAAFYAKEIAPEFLHEGRAYGPHGEGLWIANSLTDYDDARSKALTEAAKTANLTIRAHGKKPFYGPSLSSGAYTLLAWLRGEWFYGSIALKDIYFGCRVRQKDGYLQIEHQTVPGALYRRLEETVHILRQVQI